MKRMKPKKLNDIEKIFGAAQDALSDVIIGEEVIDHNTKAISVKAKVEFDANPITDDELALTETGEIFALDELKRDFIITKRALQKLVLQLQGLMESAGYMDVEEMTGTKVMAIAQIATVTNQTLMNMIEIYKTIQDIQTGSRAGQGGITNVSGDLNQSIIYAGNTSDLLKHLEDKKND